jgi:hypothetical protein
VLAIGSLVKGQFCCNECTPFDCETVPIYVHRENVVPYSQQCSKCRILIIDGLKSSKDGSPLNLFPIPERDPEIFDAQVLYQFRKNMHKANLDKDLEAFDSIQKEMFRKFVAAFVVGKIKLDKYETTILYNTLFVDYQR